MTLGRHRRAQGELISETWSRLLPRHGGANLHPAEANPKGRSGVLRSVGLALTDEDLSQFLGGPYASIVRAVALVTGDVAAAEDAVHEAIARAWERRREIQHLDRWVVTTALNLARSRHRKMRRETQGPIPERAAAGGTEELSVDFRRTLARLPRRQREVVILHYLLDMSVSDVAAALGLSEGGTKHALYRARESLASALVLDTPEVDS